MGNKGIPLQGNFLKSLILLLEQKKYNGVSKMKRKKYDKEFKVNAVKMLMNGNKTTMEVGKELGVNPQMISKWRNELKNETKLPVSKAVAVAVVSENNQEEVDSLIETNSRLKYENELLKKTLGIVIQS